MLTICLVVKLFERISCYLFVSLQSEPPNFLRFGSLLSYKALEIIDTKWEDSVIPVDSSSLWNKGEEEIVSIFQKKVVLLQPLM